MQMYPAYTLHDVMNEYAVTFFAMLNEGYRQRYEGYIALANIAMYPNADKGSQEKFMRNLEWGTKTPDDILNTDDEDSGIDGVRNLFGKI